MAHEDGTEAAAVTTQELLARAEALLRRGAAAVTWADRMYDDGRLRLDLQSRCAFADGREVRLTPTEFRLINTLTRRIWSGGRGTTRGGSRRSG